MFIDEINQIHPTLTFATTTPNPEPISENCPCKALNAVPFSDTSCSIENGKIDIDLYQKETSRNQYILSERCH